MLRKIWTIAFNDLYQLFTDRNALLITIAAPLALATIIGLAFGGIASGSGNISIPVALVNLDKPVAFGDQVQTMGDIFEEALVPPASATAEELEQNALWSLLATQPFTDVVAARRAVEAGDFVAAVIIPADFSATLASSTSAGATAVTTSTTPVAAAATIEVYGNPGSPTSTGIVQSIVESFATQLGSGTAAVSATIDALLARAQARPEFAAQFYPALAEGRFTPDFDAALAQEDVIRIEQQNVTGEELLFNPFATIGVSQAIFFMLFTAMATAGEFLRDKREGRLGRMMATPTRTSTIVIGRIVGATISCAAQVLVLIVALTVISGLVMGEFQLIFGTNFIGLLAVIVTVAMAASGLAMMIASLVNTPELAQGIMALLAMAMGVLGGAFFDVSSSPLFADIRRFSINFWGVDAITRLSQGNNAILLNLGVLLSIGVITLLVAFFMFNRKLEA